MAGGPEDHFTDSRELYVLVDGDEWALSTLSASGREKTDAIAAAAGVTDGHVCRDDQPLSFSA